MDYNDIAEEMYGTSYDLLDSTEQMEVELASIELDNL